jgi:phospholipid-translocating ATPase
MDKQRNKFIRRINYFNNFNSGNYSHSFRSKTPTSAINREYEILNILEFDSNRKRMSILVRDVELNQYLLFCKGADTSIFENSTCGTAHLYENCLKTFSENGWRTLVLSYKMIDGSEYESYKRMLNEANNDILNREKRIADVYGLMESGLSVIGVTAVEDKLQENVENTLSSLRKAGIRVWVLTGDKLETAVNISQSCKHFSREMFMLVLRDLKDKNHIKQNLKEVKER